MDGSTTSLVLKKESWLTPHTTFIFEVKAQSGKYVGQWKTVSAFVGELNKMFRINKEVNLTVFCVYTIW